MLELRTGMKLFSGLRPRGKNYGHVANYYSIKLFRIVFAAFLLVCMNPIIEVLVLLLLQERLAVARCPGGILERSTR